MRIFHQHIHTCPNVDAQPLVSNYLNTSIVFTPSALNFDETMLTHPRDINSNLLMINGLNITPTGNQTLNLDTNWLRAVASLPLTLGAYSCLGPLVFFLALGLALRILGQNRHGFFNHQHPAIFTNNLNPTPGHHTAPAA